MKNVIYTGRLISLLMVNISLFYIFNNIKDFTTKIIFIPFILCGFVLLVQVILLMMNKQKLATILGKIYIITFLVYWFGFLGFFLLF